MGSVQCSAMQQQFLCSVWSAMLIREVRGKQENVPSVCNRRYKCTLVSHIAALGYVMRRSVSSSVLAECGNTEMGAET